jgi:nucleoside-diphosphate-sugar epimerase
MDVFIVGGTGLIGAEIARQSVAAGHEVTVFTRGESDPAVPLPGAVDAVTGDRHDATRLEAAVAAAEPDCLIDMVCFTPETAHAAVTAVRDHVDQYVFCSTIDVYHRPPARNPVVEGMARAPNVSDYGRNKARAEDVFFEADAEGALAATVIRPWATYGEGSGLLHTFGTGTWYLDRLRAGAPIVVHGDGTSLWGSCHREDVARAFVNAVGTEAAYGEAYHVTSDETITWNQHHRRVANAIGAPEPELVHVPTDILLEALPDRTGMLRDHVQFSTVFDDAKARRDLGFEYTIDLEAGAERTVAWLDERDAVADRTSAPFVDDLVAAWRDVGADVVEAMAPARDRDQDRDRDDPDGSGSGSG